MRRKRIIATNGRRYRVVPQDNPTRWEVAEWCDCALGPHWHYQGDVRTPADVGGLACGDVEAAK